MPSKKIAAPVLYGLIAGLALILLTTLLYLGGVNVFLGPAAYLGYLILIGLASAAALAEKKAGGGYLEFRDALKAAFIVFVIAMALQSIFSWILMNYIDPNFRKTVEQAILDKTEKFMQSWGLSQDKIDETLTKERGKNQYAFQSTMLGLMFAYVVSFLVALVIAAIVKKKKPQFKDEF